MKSNKNNRKAQFGRIGVVSLMALSLSSHTVFGLDLWYTSGPNKDQIVKSLVDSDKTESIDWLTKKDATKFLEKFSTEPKKFAEALQEAFKKNSSEAEFKTQLREAFKAIDASKFGGEKQKDAYLKIIDRAILTDTASEEWLDIVFASNKDKEALNVTSIKPVKKEEKEKEKEKDGAAVGEQASSDFDKLCEIARQQQSQIDKMNELSAKLKKESEDAKKANEDKELANQQRLQALEQQLAQANAAFTAAQEQANKIDPNALAKNAQEKDASDVLNGLLASLVDDQNKRNAEEEVAQPQNNQQPFFPQQARVNPSNANAFNQPLPQTNPFNPYMMSMNQNQGLQAPVTYDLGITGGRAELSDAQEILSANDMRQPVASTLSPMATIQDLVVAKSRVSGDVKRTQAALQNAKDKASQLDERLEELKEGGRAALSPSVKQRLAQLKQAVDTKQSYLNQQRQMLQMLSPDQRDQLNNTLMYAQMDLNNAEQQYNQYNAQVEIAIEQANGQIKALAKQRDQLNSAANKLQSQMSSLKEDETAVSQLINNQMQAQIQQINAGNTNVNRIRNGRPSNPIRSSLSGGAGNYVRPALAK